MDEALFYQEQYQVIKSWGNIKNTFLVKDTFQNRLAVMTVLPEHMKPVIDKVKNVHQKNIPQIRDYFLKDGTICIYQEYVSGQLLSEKLKEEKLFSPETAIDYLKQLCAGVHELHQCKIVHRNLTPDHLLITEEGILKIVDFNISREIKEHSTRDTQFMGTPGYAAPEQFGFEQSTQRTDIYAMGVLLNVMLTGMLPSKEIYNKNSKLKQIIQKCIAVDERNHYADVLQIKEDLERSDGAYYLKKVIREIPGLRSEKKTSLAAACIGYPIYMFWGYLVFQMDGNRMHKIFHMIFLFLLPFIIMTDAGNAIERIFHWKTSEKMWINYGIRVLLCGCVFFLYMLIIFVSILYADNGF